MPTSYLDFDLLIERTEERYRARVVDSPAGQATVDFQLPVSSLEMENFILRIGRALGAMRRDVEQVRRLESSEREAIKAFGGRLFEAVFDEEVNGCLRASLNEAFRRGAGLRIRLRLSDTPELANVPWEYLYNPTLNRFFSLSTETPLVRYLDLPEGPRTLGVKAPLRILVMISSPQGYPQLDVAQEWDKLTAALAELEREGKVTLSRLPRATMAELQRELRRGEYHILHFIGHGGFVERAEDSALLLEDEQGRGRLVVGQDLGTILHGYRPLRLAVLNACEGARGSPTDPFAGVAQGLVQQGVPAVIAMQFEITDRAAITFAQEFYGALSDGYPVDTALAEARRAIFASGNEIEWATPVLYMRSPNGRIFKIDRRPREAPAPGTPVPAAPEPQAATPPAPERLMETPPPPEPQEAAPPTAEPVAVTIPATPEPEPATPEPEPEEAPAPSVMQEPAPPVSEEESKPPATVVKGIRDRRDSLTKAGWILSLGSALLMLAATFLPLASSGNESVWLWTISSWSVAGPLVAALGIGLSTIALRRSRMQGSLLHGAILGFGLFAVVLFATYWSSDRIASLSSLSASLSVYAGVLGGVLAVAGGLILESLAGSSARPPSQRNYWGPALGLAGGIILFLSALSLPIKGSATLAGEFSPLHTPPVAAATFICLASLLAAGSGRWRWLGTGLLLSLGLEAALSFPPAGDLVRSLGASLGAGVYLGIIGGLAAATAGGILARLNRSE